MSHFFAQLSRLKFIQRWSLMRNTSPENVQEHSLRVAQIAHTLALIRNRRYGGTISPERVALVAIYHDATEVLTGDLPSPIKYFNPAIRDSYRAIEAAAAERLLDMLPDDLRDDFVPLLGHSEEEEEVHEMVKAADKLCAWLKCLQERQAGNLEFSKAEESLRAEIEALGNPEVGDFVELFAPSFKLTVDESM